MSNYSNNSNSSEIIQIIQIIQIAQKIYRIQKTQIILRKIQIQWQIIQMVAIYPISCHRRAYLLND